MRIALSLLWHFPVAAECCAFSFRHVGRLRQSLLLVGTAMLITITASATARAQSTGATSQAPAFKPLRCEEDYRYLQDPAARTDFWDPIKYIPLAERAHLSLGGELRERFEYYSAPNFGLAVAEADGYLLHRFLLHGDLHVGDAFRTFVQLGSHLASDQESSVGAFVDRLDLQQAFVDVKLPLARDAGIAPTLRAGRQEIELGSQRLVSIRDAPNVRRNFDGFRLGDTIDDVRIDALATRPVLQKQGAFDDQPNQDQEFWAIYSTVPARFVPGLVIDIYYLGFNNDRARFAAASGREHRHSVGTRLFGALGSWDWDWEALGQFGSFAGQDIRAWTVSTHTGYTFRDVPWAPRLSLKADIASGDDDPADGTLGTFNALFPKLAYFNQAALVAPANLFDVHPALAVKPLRDLTVTLGWDFLWRHSTKDSVYVAPLTPVARTAGRGGRFIGHQIALEAVWRFDRHVQIEASYVHFSVGDALRAGGGRDVDFAMMSVAYKF
jgi:hypothetical protein